MQAPVPFVSPTQPLYIYMLLSCIFLFPPGPLVFFSSSSLPGDAKAQNAYARMLFDGSNGVAEDRPEAIALWQKSAAQQNAAAQCNFGVM